MDLPDRNDYVHVKFRSKWFVGRVCVATLHASNSRLSIYLYVTPPRNLCCHKYPPQVKRVTKSVANIQFADGDEEIEMGRLTSERYRHIGSTTPPPEWDGCSRPLNEAISGWADDGLTILEKQKRVEAKERKALHEAVQARLRVEKARERAIR